MGQIPDNAGARVVTDDLGRSVTLPEKVTRIVSLAPSVTESVFAVGAGDRLVGDTTYCNYPEAAKAIAKVGDTLTPNIESIVALKPDIVLVSTASQIEAFTQKLGSSGISVYVTDPKGVDGVITSLRKLADVLGTRAESEKAIADLEARVVHVQTAVAGSPQTRVFLQFSKDPLFTAGSESYLTSLVREAGGESVTANVPTAFPKLSRETAVTLRPDVIVLSDSSDNPAPNDAFADSPAIKKQRVFRINPDILSRPGPRIVDALETLARVLHPEKFDPQ